MGGGALFSALPRCSHFICIATEKYISSLFCSWSPFCWAASSLRRAARPQTCPPSLASPELPAPTAKTPLCQPSQVPARMQMDSVTSPTARAELSTFNAGSGTPRLHGWGALEGPGPRRPGHLWRRGRLARPPAGPRAPLHLNSLAAAPSSLPGPSPRPRPARPELSAAAPRRSAPEAARPPHRPRLGLSAPLPSTARSARPRSRRAAPTARARGPALTREGRWRRRSSTCAARRAEAGTRAPQQQPRQPPSCQHRSGRHRPPAPPGGGRGRGLLLKGPHREPKRAGRGLAGRRPLPPVSHAVLS